jgi:hypothetical protein
LAWKFLSRGWVAKMAFEKYSKPRCALSFTTFPYAISSSRRFAESNSKTAASFSRSSSRL